MRKAVFFPAVLLLLIVPMVGQAADLQAGWYANVRFTNIYVYNLQGALQLIGEANFSGTPVGQVRPVYCI